MAASPMSTDVVTPIVALDVGTGGEAHRIISRLEGLCRFYKIGNELFTAEGPAVVRSVIERGADVFLDLKFHDIPNTVRGAVRSASRLGVKLITVHGVGGREMVEAAVDAAGTRAGILAVTVLTSADAAALGEAWGRESVRVEDEVLRLAKAAADVGAHGVVCSGQEAGLLRTRLGDRLKLLVPGVRFVDGAANDQARVVTPRGAAEAGASYIVLGRAVTAADDPADAMHRVLEELGAARAEGLSGG